VTETAAVAETGNDASGSYNTDGPFVVGTGGGMGGEMDYDTQAYQSLAALLEASNDTDIFQNHDRAQ
jgi:hypothetical protein